MDVRVLRTKNAIRKSFFELMIQKEMQEITLTELSLKAGVNRQTLYNYYNNVNEILDDFVMTLFEHYKKVINQTDILQCINNPMTILMKINSIIKEDLDFYHDLFTMKHNLILTKNISDFLTDIVSEAFKKYKVFPLEKVDIITSYYVHGLLGCYQYYFEHMDLNLDEYSRYVGDLVFSGIKHQLVKR